MLAAYRQARDSPIPIMGYSKGVVRGRVVGRVTRAPRAGAGSWCRSAGRVLACAGGHAAAARAAIDGAISRPIASEVADGPQSVIRQQVQNGVAVRRAVLATIVRNVQARNVEAGRRAG